MLTSPVTREPTKAAHPPVRCAVLGAPIGHSLSPVLHQAAYEALGLTNWVYERHEVTEEQLGDFIAGCDASWRGLSLTHPLKVAALTLGQPDELTGLVGAANTLIFEPTGRLLRNTDVDGIGWALQHAGFGPVDKVTILGAGATTRSVLAALVSLGRPQINVVARDPGKVGGLQPLARSLDLSLTAHPWGVPLPKADLIISTVTAGAADGLAQEAAASAGGVFDVVYDPWPTELARAAAKSGRALIGGLDLLVGQALGQIQLMTGRAVDPEVLISAGRAALDRPAHGLRHGDRTDGGLRHGGHAQIA